MLTRLHNRNKVAFAFIKSILYDRVNTLRCYVFIFAKTNEMPDEKIKQSALNDDLDCWRDVWVHSLTYQMLSKEERDRDTKNFQTLKRLAANVNR